MNGMTGYAVRDFIEMHGAKYHVEHRSRGNDGAVFSPCMRYRYLLWRVWDDSLPLWSFGMLNPSTADHRKLDPTLIRCRSFAQRGGAGGMVIWNLFAWRDNSIKALLQPSPVGKGNDRAILRATWHASINIACWGTHGDVQHRDKDVLRLLSVYGRELHALAFTIDGHPRYPLFLKADLSPQPWDFDTYRKAI